MMYFCFKTLALVAILECGVSFHSSFMTRTSLGRVIGGAMAVSREPTLLSMGGNPDLFSDDLFEDDGDSEDKAVDSTKNQVAVPKRKYLDEDWELSTEDAKEFDGFPGTKEARPPVTGDAPEVPCFALMYKFRREYQEVSVASMVADHKGYCAKFKRLINSDLIDLGKAKGIVLLWGGLSADDKTETKADIMKFLEQDPLIIQDLVEKWDVIDLEEDETREKLPPLKPLTEGAADTAA